MPAGKQLSASAVAAGAGLSTLLAAPLAAHAYLGTFTRYMADDFCVAAVAQTRGFWAEQAYWFLNWSGRFAYTFFTSVALLFGPNEAAWQPALLLLAWTAALGWALAALPLALDRRVRWGTAVLLALLLIGLTLTAIPNAAQSLYWRNSALTYALPLVAGCLLMGTILRARGWTWTLAAALLALAGAGFAEIYGVTQTAALGLAVTAGLYWRWQAHARRSGPAAEAMGWHGRALFAALAGSITGLVVVALAPGTGARQETFGDPPTLGALAYNVPQYALWFVRDAAQQQLGAWAAATVGPALLAYTLVRGGQAAAWTARQVRWGLAVVPLALYALLAASYAPAFYALQYLPPDRVLIVQWMVLLSMSALWGWLAGVSAAGIRLGGAEGRHSLTTTALLAAAAMVIAVPGLKSANATLAQRDGAAQFTATWEAYDRLLRGAAGTGTVTLTQLPNPGGIEHFGEDADYWPNRCAANYYGVDIRAEPPPPVPALAELETLMRLDAQLGEAARVIGYRLGANEVRAGERLEVTLYWEPLALTDRPYTVFVHLLHPAAGSVAQTDAYPYSGQYPTTRWLLGRLFAEAVHLDLPTDAPPGEAVVIVGLYDLETGQRLAASGANANAEGEAWVEAGRVQIVPADSGG